MSDALPEGWSIKPLGELAQVVSGGTPSRNVPYFWEEGMIPWVTPTDITATHGKYISDSKDKITKLGLMGCSASLLPSGSILMTSRATLGEAKISMMPACTNQGFKSLVAKPGVSNQFLYYQIQRTKQQYARFGSGSTFLEVGKKDTDAFPVMIPDEDRQAKIAELLSLLDTQIEATEGLIAKQERVRAGLMQDLFTRGVDEHGQLRPPRDQAPHLYHQTELGWLPLGWEVVQMGNHIQKIDSGWSPTCDSEPAADDEWGVLKTTAVVWPGYDSTENKRLPDSVKQVASVETKSGDILITRKGPMERVGVAVYVETTRPRLMFPDTVFRTRALPSDALIPRFLVAAMQSEAVQKHWWQRKVGLADAQVNINHGIVRNTPFQLPPQDEQSRILAAISTYEAIQRDYQGELPKLKSAKTGLMQDLLTGKVSVAPLLESAAA